MALVNDFDDSVSRVYLCGQFVLVNEKELGIANRNKYQRRTFTNGTVRGPNGDRRLEKGKEKENRRREKGRVNMKKDIGRSSPKRDGRRRGNDSSRREYFL